jgi:hypothetical protein
LIIDAISPITLTIMHFQKQCVWLIQPEKLYNMLSKGRTTGFNQRCNHRRNNQDRKGNRRNRRLKTIEEHLFKLASMESLQEISVEQVLKSTTSE